MIYQRLNNYWAIVVFAFVLTAQAQPEKLLENYKPVIELTAQVVALLELETTTDMKLLVQQATSLEPMLTFLQTSDTLTNDEATAYQQQLSEDILTPEQRDWMLVRAVEVSGELFNPQGKPPGGFGLAMKLMAGEPVNLVKEGPGKDSLNKLAELVAAKAD
jgi:hypothetical protein